MMSRIYFLLLHEYGGRITVKPVDQQTWDWIESPNMGRSQKEARETSWNDESCPIEVKKKIWDELDEDEKRDEYNNNFHQFEVRITIGSWVNDRAILAPTIDQKQFYSTKEAYQWAVKNGYDIQDEYHGNMY